MTKHSFASQAGIAPLVIILIVAGGLLTAGTGTVVVADSAKPGDVLYGIDTAVENLRLTLTANPESEVELRTKIAAERVAEVEAILTERGVDAPGLEVALANLTQQRQAIADLVAAHAELKAKAKAIEDTIEQQERELEAVFEAARVPLKARKEQLKAQLEAAIAKGDVVLAQQLAQQLAAVKAQLDALEAQEEAAEEQLEVQEELMEAQFEAEEEALEQQEEALEEQEEALKEKEEREEDEDEEIERLIRKSGVRDNEDGEEEDKQED